MKFYRMYIHDTPAIAFPKSKKHFRQPEYYIFRLPEYFKINKLMMMLRIVFFLQPREQPA